MQRLHSGHLPVVWHDLVLHHVRVRQEVNHLGVVTVLIIAIPEFHRKKIRGRPRETQPHFEDQVTPKILSTGRELFHLESKGKIIGCSSQSDHIVRVRLQIISLYIYMLGKGSMRIQQCTW